MKQHAGTRALVGMLALALTVGIAVAGCAPAAVDSIRPAAVDDVLPIYADIVVNENLAYGERDGQPLLLDACQPADAAASALNNGPRRAVISVHGGSWRSGDKADPAWRNVCEWLASEGFIAFSVGYSLAPGHPFPAGIDDIRAAISWLRAPEQVEAYGYDPALIGAFGGSAGGNLVSLLATSGAGPWDVGTRVAAVVDLSGPIDLTTAGLDMLPDGFAQRQLDYLGCADYDRCDAAAAASPNHQVDPSDPPQLIVHAEDEYIPAAQGQLMADALRSAGVPVTLETVPGDGHSLELLDDELRGQIVEFLRGALR
ncbi:acetyl esterase/lipase [Homoserinimonas aerilata]|uniref:Acetyl esterase/lipase n=1 Tax=Homoserinimonas aerilata TaxID=1162970 RepID=A0A542XX89_9MICO|nr:alpha/beta hydrolase [Homoserinimonas aerilata]TQL40442.1 acetyl esterase/lipase [Homoserinimonas aerilata]